MSSLIPMAAAYIEPIRAAARRLVRELGFMHSTLAGTAMSASAVHALVEMGHEGALQANDLADRLRLDKSTVSRLVRKLVRTGVVKEAPGKADGRTKELSLTPKGERVLGKIHTFARGQVAAALKRLPKDKHAAVLHGLSLYAGALAGERYAAASTARQVRIKTGYDVNVFARCIEMQTGFYARAHGLGRTFETFVARGLADFSPRMDKPCNGFWRAVQDGRTVGTIAIDGEDLGPGIGHLRWFIVDDDIRGGGVGKKLLAAAIAFCDARKFSETHLWTFRGLDAARRLYEAHGFVLVDEVAGSQWGKDLMEQHFVRRRG